MSRALILVPILLLILVGLFFALRPDSSAPESSTPGDATTSESTGGQEKTVDVAVNGGSMTPNRITVNEGDRVNLRITSDSPLEFHVHGYDLEKEVEANTSADLPFDANITGRFQVEDHDSDTELGELVVQPR